MIFNGKTSSCNLVALTAIVYLISTLSFAQSDDSAKNQSSADQAAIFEWFDGLGFKDFSKLPLVRVTTGSWSQYGNDEPKNSVIYAFLMDESKDGFRV